MERKELFVAPVPAMALTVGLLGCRRCGEYIGQRARDAEQGTGYVAVIGVLQLILASFWLNLFRYGPVEWVWRKLSTGVSKPPPST